MAYNYTPLPGGTTKRILARDHHTCYLCRGLATQVDHVVPVSQGGTHDPANLAAICAGPGSCHERKSKAERQAGIDRRKRTRRRNGIEQHPGVLGAPAPGIPPGA